MILPYVIAVDPGMTTGLCLRYRDGTIHHAQLPANEAADFVTSAKPDVLVVESFVISSNTVTKGRDGIHDALNLIGYLTHWARLNSVPINMQTPAMGKRVSNDLLKERGLDIKSMLHAREAARHLLIHLDMEEMSRREGLAGR